jgi:CheY-like chemotaxis protein
MAYRILIVEDEADTRELLVFTLGLDGHHVEVAENGRGALELLARRSFDVILSDLYMPGMDGEELYRRIERSWPHLASRVVFVTAATPDTSRVRSAGPPIPVLTKPYTVDRLRQVIAEVIARRE